jgi:RNA polymerase sigma factor (sigma-70 family)
MPIEDLFGEPGAHWPEEIIPDVFQWIERTMLTDLVQFAFGWTRIAFNGHPQQEALALALAKDVVATKLEDIMLRRLHTYDPTRYKGEKCPFRNWLMVIIAKAAIKVSRREQHRQARLQRLQQQAQRQQPRRRSQPPLNTGLEWEQLWELAQPCLGRLLPKYQEALVLCCKEGLTRPEAAHRAGCTTGAIKVRLHRARHELWALIQREGSLL